MIKRRVPFLMVAVMFIMASCTTSSSPQKSYATEMEPAIKLLTKWQADYVDLEALLIDPGSSSTGISRLQMMELYNMATEYQITRDDYVDMGFSPLDDLVVPSIKLSKDGQTILNILSEITPVEEAQAYHQVVMKCIQTRISFAEELSSAIKSLGPINLSGDVSDCETFETSLDELTTYMNKHK